MSTRIARIVARYIKRQADDLMHFETKTLAEIGGQEVEIDFEADVEFDEPGAPYIWSNMKITTPDGRTINLGSDTEAAWERWKIDVNSMDGVHELFLAPNPYEGMEPARPTRPDDLPDYPEGELAPGEKPGIGSPHWSDPHDLRPGK